MTAAPMQGTYIPQYTPVPPTAVSIEVSLSHKRKEARKEEKYQSHKSPWSKKSSDKVFVLF